MEEEIKDKKLQDDVVTQDEQEEITSHRAKYSGNSSFASLLNRIGDILLLHFTFLICSLPVITIGASLSAAAYVGMKMASGTEGYVISNFIKAFKENFKRSTLYFLLVVASGALIVFAYRYWFLLGESIGLIMGTVTVVLAIVWLMFLLYIFAVQAKFENTFRNTMINSMLMSVRHLPSTLLMILIIGIFAFLVFNFGIMQWIGAISGAGILALLYGKVYNNVFSHYA